MQYKCSDDFCCVCMFISLTYHSIFVQKVLNFPLNISWIILTVLNVCKQESSVNLSFSRKCVMFAL